MFQNAVVVERRSSGEKHLMGKVARSIMPQVKAILEPVRRRPAGARKVSHHNNSRTSIHQVNISKKLGGIMNEATKGVQLKQTIEVEARNLADPRFSPLERLEYQLELATKNSKIYAVKILLEGEDFISRIDGIAYRKSKNKLRLRLSPNANIDFSRKECQSILSKSRSIVKKQISQIASYQEASHLAKHLNSIQSEGYMTEQEFINVMSQFDKKRDTDERNY